MTNSDAAAGDGGGLPSYNPASAPTAAPISWNAIWVAAQELGAAMRPLIESGDAPEWAVELSNALVEADEELTELAMQEVDDEPL